MLIPLNQFFDSMEQKRCEICGSVIEEQADCYTCTCEKCDTFQPHHTFTSLNGSQQ